MEIVNKQELPNIVHTLLNNLIFKLYKLFLLINYT